MKTQITNPAVAYHVDNAIWFIEQAIKAYSEGKPYVALQLIEDAECSFTYARDAAA